MAVSESKLREIAYSRRGIIGLLVVKILTFPDSKKNVRRWSRDLAWKIMLLGMYRTKEHNNPLSREEYHEILFMSRFENHDGSPQLHDLRGFCVKALAANRKGASRYGHLDALTLESFFARMKIFYKEVAVFLSDQLATYEGIEALIERHLYESTDGKPQN